MRGASEFESGADGVCPQGVPIYWFNNNEGHNNGRYGLRIFTGRSAHNGEGVPGFYPRSSDPCAPVSETNTFVREGAKFQRQFSWRNGHNGIAFGSIASLHLSEPIVADNNMRGIECLGADAVSGGLMAESKLRGGWGANKIVNALIVGHGQVGCPACDHSFAPNFPNGGPAGWSDNDGRVRIGVTMPAWSGLTLENTTFVNYDREGMIAVGGFAKAVPIAGAGYDFLGNGGFETRFERTTWHEADHRLRWRWDNEGIVADLDGTFAEQPFCAGCHLLSSAFTRNTRAFPGLN